MASRKPIKVVVAKPGVTKTEPKYRVPQTLEEATLLIATIGEKRRGIHQRTSATDAEIEAMHAKAMEDIAPDIKDLTEAFAAIKAFAEARRKELTDDGKRKTIETVSGTFGWKNTPPKLEIADEEAVVAAIEALKDPDLEAALLRRTPQIDKEALKKRLLEAAKLPDEEGDAPPEKPELNLPGVKVTQTEEFRVKPKEDTTELTQSKIDEILKQSS